MDIKQDRKEDGQKTRSFLLSLFRGCNYKCFLIWDARKEGRQTMDNTEVGNVIEYIDSDYYIQQINIIIRGCCLEMQIDKPDSNQINGFLRVAFNNLFRTEAEAGKVGERVSKIALNEDNVTAMIEIYVAVCETWNALPSQYGFERLSGIKIETACQYVTAARDLLQIARKTYVQNRLNNSPLGILTLANNDIETGLLYTRQNIVTHEAVKKSLSFEDLKRIANNIDIPEKP